MDGSVRHPQDAGTIARMVDPVTTDDVLPLIARMATQERAKLFRAIATTARSREEAEIYRAMPTGQDEFSQDDEGLAWEAEGWEAFD